MSYSRFALYYVPPEGALAEFGAAWLGWDILHGVETPQLDVAGLHDVTLTPGKYGFHGTLKPPFRLAAGATVAELDRAVSDLAARQAQARCDGLDLVPLGRFLALVPDGPTGDLQRLAGTCVRDLDAFRAPAEAADLARRRQAGITARQDALLVRWGYPYVMDEFRFHLTLTGRLSKDAVSHWRTVLHDRLPALPTPFVIDEIALCGERMDGRFEVLHRYTLTG